MPHTYVILDGLQDPDLAGALSANWAAAGFANEVDAAAQSGWLAPAGGDADAALTESEFERAAGLARACGVALYGRVGQRFLAANDPAALRASLARAYRARVASALVFGLPALGLHYAGSALAGGDGAPRSMFLAWLLELLLVGWCCVAVGWPLLWQGLLGLAHRRATGDVLTSALVAITFLPSVAGMIAMLWGGRPWFSASAPGVPLLHATTFVLLNAVLQRWLFQRRAAGLSGRAPLMLRRFGAHVIAWLALTFAALVFGGWETGVAIGMLLPPLAGLGAVNRWSPGLSLMLPVWAFALLLLIGPQALGRNVEGVRVEIAAGFSLIFTAAMALGWKGEGAGEGTEARRHEGAKGGTGRG